MTNGNDLVAPRDGEGEREYKLSDGTVVSIPYAFEKGLTKREYFAAMAMQGIIGTVSADDYAHGIAADAVDLADNLIEALNK